MPSPRSVDELLPLCLIVDTIGRLHNENVVPPIPAGRASGVCSLCFPTSNGSLGEYVIQLLVFSTFVSFSFKVSNRGRHVLREVAMVYLACSVSNGSRAFVRASYDLVSRACFRVSYHGLPLYYGTSRTLRRGDTGSFFLSIPTRDRVNGVSLVRGRGGATMARGLFFLFRRRGRNVVPNRGDGGAFFYP